MEKTVRTIVHIDEELCNGCGYCSQFCPFGVPHLSVASPLAGTARARADKKSAIGAYSAAGGVISQPTVPSSTRSSATSVM